MAELAQSVIVGDTPGSPNGAIAPIVGTSAVLTADPRRQYVSAGAYAWYQNYARSLPWAFDDLTIDFGDDIYERMAFDAQIAACLTIYKASVIEEGLSLAPALDDSDADGYDLSKEILGYCERVIDDLSPSIDDTLWMMLDAAAYGNKVAELAYADERTYTGKLRVSLTGIKPKPRRVSAFVVDTYMNVLGLVALIPGIGAPVQTGTILALDNPGKIPNLLPRSKFAILTFRPRDTDPRGTSILRPAYTAWWTKMQTWPEYLKYLAQFASPGLIGYTAPNADYLPALDSDGNLTGGAASSPEQIMVNTLTNFRNGAVLAFTNGSKVDSIQSQGEGRAFLTAFEAYDKQISKGILTQTLATGEGKSGTRAQGQVHQDVLTTLVRQGRRAVVRMLKRDVLRQLVELNYGPKAAFELTPKPSLGQVEQQDFASTAGAIASLKTASYLDPSQFPEIDEMLNLPARDPESITRMIEQQQVSMVPGPAQPAGTPQDEQKEAA